MGSTTIHGEVLDRPSLTCQDRAAHFHSLMVIDLALSLHLLLLFLLLFLESFLGLLCKFTHRAQTSHEIRIIESHVNVTIVPSNPVLNVLFGQIATKFEISEEYSKVIRINISVRIEIDMSEYFEHTEVLFAHQLLLVDFHSFDGLDFLFENFDDRMFDVIT